MCGDVNVRSMSRRVDVFDQARGEMVSHEILREYLESVAIVFLHR